MTAKTEILVLPTPCETKVMKNIKNEKSCEERCEIFLKKCWRKDCSASLRKRIKKQLDEKWVNELITEAKLEKYNISPDRQNSYHKWS